MEFTVSFDDGEGAWVVSCWDKTNAPIPLYSADTIEDLCGFINYIHGGRGYVYVPIGVAEPT